MKKIVFILILASCLVLNTFPQTQFRKLIGGFDEDVAESIIQTSDGGYALAGYTFSFGVGIFNMYIVKLDANGDVQWKKTIGGSSIDDARSIIQTTDGGYAIAGYTDSYGAGNYDVVVLKLNSSGTLQWYKVIGGTGDDIGFSILQTTDGGYTVSGHSRSFGSDGMYIIKLDSNGSILWNRIINGADADGFQTCIVQSSDGGYVSSGSTNSYGAGNYDIYIVKLNSSGTLQWAKTVGDTGTDNAFSIIATADGGYAAAGQTNSFGAGNYDMYIVKLDGTGTLQWTGTVGSSANEYTLSLIQTTDGGYAAAGYTFLFGQFWDTYLFKLDSRGTLQWSKRWQETGIDDAASIIHTTDGGYALAGEYSAIGAGNSDAYIVKFDADWNTCGNTTTPASQSGTGGTLTTPTPSVTSPTPTVSSPTPTVSSDGIFTNICNTVGIKNQQNEIPKEFKLYQNYPNPFNPSTKIRFALPKSSFAKVVVYDLLGREVVTLVNEQLNAGTYEAEWNATNYPSGIYYYKLITGSRVLGTKTRKAVLIK